MAVTVSATSGLGTCLIVVKNEFVALELPVTKDSGVKGRAQMLRTRLVSPELPLGREVEEGLIILNDASFFGKLGIGIFCWDSVACKNVTAKKAQYWYTISN